MRDPATITITPMQRGCVAEIDGAKHVFLQNAGSGGVYYGEVAHDGCTMQIKAAKMPGHSNAFLVEASLTPDNHLSPVKSESIAAVHHEVSIPMKTVLCEDPFAAVSEFFESRTGAAMRINPNRIASMFNGHASDEIIFSPLVYDPISDTIQSAQEGCCVVAFEDGLFSRRRLGTDPAVARYTTTIDLTITIGRRDDFAPHQSDDYCKRRLAWLAGAFHANKFRHKEISAGLLTSRMEWLEKGFEKVFEVSRPEPFVQPAPRPRKAVAMGM